MDWGGDLSWSRIKQANEFVENEAISANRYNLFVGDMQNLPLKTNSIDLVYTMYALEPNGGRERQLMEELYRVSSKWLILLEPNYENANAEQRAWMDKHGYVKGLEKTAKELGYHIIKYDVFPINENPMNPTSIMIIKKDAQSEMSGNKFCCPITKTDISVVEGSYYSDKSFLAYPIVGSIPCLLPDNAIVATKMAELYNENTKVGWD